MFAFHLKSFRFIDLENINEMTKKMLPWLKLAKERGEMIDCFEADKNKKDSSYSLHILQIDVISSKWCRQNIESLV